MGTEPAQCTGGHSRRSDSGADGGELRDSGSTAGILLLN